MSEAEQERAKIVAWLRNFAAEFGHPDDKPRVDTLLFSANCIERGDHVGGE